MTAGIQHFRQESTPGLSSAGGRRQRFVSLLLLAGAVSAAGPLVRGQDDDPPLRSAEEVANAERAETRAEQQETFGRLADLWTKAGSPPLVIVCGIPYRLTSEWAAAPVSVTTDGRTTGSETSVDGAPPTRQSDSPAVSTGVLAPFVQIGDDLSFSNPFCRQIAARIHRLLDEAGIDNIFANDTLIERRIRVATALQQNDERELIESIFSEMPAAFILYVRINFVADADAEGGAKLLVEPVIKLPGTGRDFGHDPFQGRVGSSERFLTAYSNRIGQSFARALTRRFEQQTGRGTIQLVKMEGVNMATVQAMREAVANAIPELKSFVPQQTRVINGVSVTDVQVRFAGGTYELYEALYKVFRDKLRLEISAKDTGDGSLTLSVQPAPPPPPAVPARWQVLAGAASPARASVLAELAAEYADEGKPKIAILINRELSDEEKKALTDAQLKAAGLDPERARAQRLLVTGAFPSAGPTDDTLNTTQLTNLLTGLLSDAGGYALDVYDPGFALRCLEEAAQRAATLHGDAQQQALIRQLKGVDIVIRGIGKRIDNATFAFTFDAVRVENGLILATATENVTDAVIDGAQPLERLAGQVAAKLVDKMMARWKPPRRMRIIVVNAPTQEAVLAVMTSIETHIEQGVRRLDFQSHRGTEGSGVGEFYLEWEGDFTSLIEAIRAKAHVLNFDLQAQDTTRDALTIRMKDALRPKE